VTVDNEDAAERSELPTLNSPPVMSAVTIWIGGGVAALIAAFAFWFLMTRYGDGTNAQAGKLDAIKTAGSIVLGTGGFVALLLAARRQRYAEIAVKQANEALSHQRRVAEDTREHQLRVADDARHDATQRRIIELYTKAADQLGSEKAAVRLAGVYALERLGQENEDTRLRQAIMNVLCAYIRMPHKVIKSAGPSLLGRWPASTPARYEFKAAEALDATDDSVIRSDATQKEEQEVRNAVQRVICSHLKPGDNQQLPLATFWPNIDLDLSGAALTFFDFDSCVVRSIDCTGTLFTAHAGFGRAVIRGIVTFHGTRFEGAADFTGTTFEGAGSFVGAHFSDVAFFLTSHFKGQANFYSARFASQATFQRCNFGATTWFDAAQFGERADFVDARFFDDAYVGGVGFQGVAYFDRAFFGKQANFLASLFQAGASFESTVFTIPPKLERVRARLSSEEGKGDNHIWPPNWQLKDAAGNACVPTWDGSWGLLTPDENDAVKPDSVTVESLTFEQDSSGL
jgi:uncharacterized protein YjbI with pentapeptide repeats